MRRMCCKRCREKACRRASHLLRTGEWGLRDYGEDGQLGLEETPEEYVQKLVEVFREVRRVLRDDGTCWLNLGDSYAANRAYQVSDQKHPNHDYQEANAQSVPSGLKEKDLCMIPSRVAMALQEDGWWVRSRIVWAKGNPMPESVTDRPTSSHEYIFLLSRGDDWTGAVEPVSMTGEQASWLAALIDGEGTLTIAETSNGGYQAMISIANSDRSLLERAKAITSAGSVCSSTLGENKDVYRWQVTSRQAASIVYRLRDKLMAKRQQAHVLLNLQETHKRYGGSGRPDHVTQKQRELYQKIKSLNSGEDVEVSENKARWRGNQYYYDADAIRQSAVKGHAGSRFDTGKTNGHAKASGRAFSEGDREDDGTRNKRDVWQVNTKPFSEAHFAVYPPQLIEPCIKAGSAEGDTVLDPFSGAGTSGVVALAKGRDYIGIDLSQDYNEMAADRIRQDAPLMNQVQIRTPDYA